MIVSRGAIRNAATIQRFAVVWMVAATIGAIPSRAAAQAPVRIDETVIRAGDLVRVTVWRKPELSGDFLIAADSSLKHPLYREVKVAGLSVAAARERLVAFLKNLENSPQVAIEPLFRVSIFGEVRSPSLYTLSPETNIAQAVAIAGGEIGRASCRERV